MIITSSEGSVVQLLVLFIIFYFFLGEKFLVPVSCMVES